MVTEFLPWARLLSPMAMFDVFTPAAVASPMAILVLPAPKLVAPVPMATLVLPSPAPFARLPITVLPASLPRPSAEKPITEFDRVVLYSLPTYEDVPSARARPPTATCPTPVPALALDPTATLATPPVVVELLPQADCDLSELGFPVPPVFEEPSQVDCASADPTFAIKPNANPAAAMRAILE